MTVWFHLPTIFKQRHALRRAGLISLCVAIITTLFFNVAAYAAPGVNQTLSFQGRLLTGSGATVPDGYYNMQFKIYQDGTSSGGGTLKWTESYVNNNANSGIQVKNGYFSTTLGSVNPFGSSVDWNQDTLFLSMNIAGSSNTCTTFGAGPCVADGEMLPMRRITSVPFAINSAQLGGRTSDGFVQNGTSPQTADFNITGTGTAANLQAASLDRASAGTLTLGGTNTTSITMADDVTVAAGKSLTLAGGNTASRPGSPTEGMVYFDTTTKQLLTYSNGKWQSSQSATKLVAASGSSQAVKDSANYVADGEDSAGSGIGTLDGDQIQINQALSDVSAAGGGIVYLAPGTYTVDATITVPSNTTLAGSGTATVIQLGNFGSTSTNINAITLTGSTSATVRDLVLDGRKSVNTVGTYYGIGATSPTTTDTTVNAVTVRNFLSYGLGMSNTDYSKVINSNFSSNTIGLYISGTNNLIQGNQANSNTSEAISVRGSGVVVSGNRADNNASFGIRGGFISNSTFTGNTITGTGAFGLQIRNATEVTLSSNVIASTQTTSILITDTATNTLLSGNIISGVAIDDQSSSTIYANQLDASGKLINKSDTGSTIQTYTNNSTAFQVQNAAGTSALTVNTSSNTVLVAGTLDTTTATTLNIGTSTATAITIGQVGVTTSIDGELEVAEIDTAGAISLEIGSSNATSINLNQNVTVAAGKSLTLAGGNTSSRPASPTEGMVYFDTTTKQLLTYANGKWQADRTEALIVAASNSSQSDKDAADYVADGNGGSANDGDQVQINSALTAASGKKVILLAGTYTADAPIAIPDNTTLAGIGQGTLVQLADLDASINLIVNSNTSTGTGITIQDLKLDGQDTLNTAGTQNGIYFNNMGDYSASRTGSTLRNVQVSNFRSQGLFYNSSDNNVISGSTIRGMDAGGATLGIYYESSSRNNNATDNVFTTNSYAIRADGSGTTNNSLTQNVFRANSYGIMLYGATNTVVSGNNFDASVNYSVSIYHDSGANGYNNVTGNSFRGDGVSISIENVHENTVSNNKIHDSGGTTGNNAIRVAGNSDRNKISGNSITDSSCATNCYAITITTSTGDANYLSDNSIGTNGTINDLGTGTIYANQLDNTGKLINKSTSGSSIQTMTNNATAFTVQNAAGTSALTVNTSTNAVLIAGTLDTTTATTLNIGTSTATAITMGTTSGNILTTLNGRALVKSTAGNNSTTAFQVQNASATALLTADTTNMQVVIGNGSDTITLSSSGISFAGNARGTKQIRLAAEYAGAVLDNGATGANSGTMVSSLDLTNRMNFYRWSASPATSQTYDIVTQVPIPQDFSAWAASNPLTITSRTSHTTDGVMTIELRDSSGTVRCNFTSLTMGSTNSWITNNPTCLSAGTYTPGDYLTIRLRMSSKNSAQVDVGNIVLNYLSNK